MGRLIRLDRSRTHDRCRVDGGRTGRCRRGAGGARGRARARDGRFGELRGRHGRGGVRAAARRRAGRAAPADRGRLSGAVESGLGPAPPLGGLAEAARLGWREDASARTLSRDGRRWTAWTSWIVAVFAVPGRVDRDRAADVSRRGDVLRPCLGDPVAAGAPRRAPGGRDRDARSAARRSGAGTTSAERIARGLHLATRSADSCACGSADESAAAGRRPSLTCCWRCARTSWDSQRWRTLGSPARAGGCGASSTSGRARRSRPRERRRA